MATEAIPKCKNRECARSDTFLLQENETSWTFACSTCRGIEVRSKPAGWAAGRQFRQYREYGRPEYARSRAFFFTGRYNR